MHMILTSARVPNLQSGANLCPAEAIKAIASLSSNLIVVATMDEAKEILRRSPLRCLILIPNNPHFRSFDLLAKGGAWPMPHVDRHGVLTTVESMHGDKL